MVDKAMPIEPPKSVIDITGMRQMLQEFNPANAAPPDVVILLLKSNREQEKEEFRAAKEAERRKATGQDVVIGEQQMIPLRDEDSQWIDDAVKKMTFKTTEATVRKQLIDEYQSYLNTPVPEYKPKPGDKEVMTFGKYIGKATELVTTLEKGNSISDEEIVFLKEFSKRALAVNIAENGVISYKTLMLPKEFQTIKTDTSLTSPIAIQWDKDEGEKPATDRFAALERALVEHERRVSDAIRIERGHGTTEELIQKITPKFYVPKTEEAIFNLVAGADWKIDTENTIMMKATIDMPNGLISDQPLLDVVKQPGLSSLKVTKLPKGPDKWVGGEKVVVPDKYTMTISRAAYDVALSPLTDRAFVQLKMGRQNAYLLEPNYSITEEVGDKGKKTKKLTEYICSLTDEHAKIAKARLDALQVPYSSQPGITYISMDADKFEGEQYKKALEPLKKLLEPAKKGAFPMFKEKLPREGGAVVLMSTDGLKPEELAQLSKALDAVKLGPKLDVTLTQGSYILFEPDVYEKKVVPVNNQIYIHSLGKEFSRKVLDAVNGMLKPPAAQPNPADAKKQQGVNMPPLPKTQLNR